MTYGTGISPTKHWLICRLAHRMEMRTPPEVIAKITGYGMPITSDHLNYFFDLVYDAMSPRYFWTLVLIYVLGTNPLKLQIDFRN